MLSSFLLRGPALPAPPFLERHQHPILTFPFSRGPGRVGDGGAGPRGWRGRREPRLLTTRPRRGRLCRAVPFSCCPFVRMLLLHGKSFSLFLELSSGYSRERLMCALWVPGHKNARTSFTFFAVLQRSLRVALMVTHHGNGVTFPCWSHALRLRALVPEGKLR